MTILEAIQALNAEIQKLRAAVPKKPSTLGGREDPAEMLRHIAAREALRGACSYAALQVAHWHGAIGRQYKDPARSAILSLLPGDELRFWSALDATPHTAHEDAALSAQADHADRGGDLAHLCRVAQGARAVQVWQAVADLANRI